MPWYFERLISHLKVKGAILKKAQGRNVSFLRYSPVHSTDQRDSKSINK